MVQNARILATLLILWLPLVTVIAQELPAPTDDEPASEAVAGDAVETPSETGSLEEESIDAPPPNSYEIRERLMSVLADHPPELKTIIALDPSLLANEAFLAHYPRLGEFVAENPEVQRNTSFYLGRIHIPGEERSAISEMLEVIVISATFLLVALALAWIIRTFIEQKRWSRLSKTQSEVHNRLLDRFETNEELLAYIRTPAGSKFLESAPIPLSSEQPVHNAPMTRIMWSIQIGVVIAAGALGLLLVSFLFEKQAAKDLMAMGVIAFCVGGGFVGSAIASLVMSRRLGLWEPPQSPAASPTASPADDVSTVR